MSNWTSNFLATKLTEAENKLAIELNVIIDRLSLEIYAGVNTYSLPEYTIGVNRFTWQGKKLIPATFNEIAKYYGRGFSDSMIAPAFSPTAFSNAFAIGGAVSTNSLGTPIYYVYDTVGYNKVQLYPMPNAAIAISASNLYKGHVIKESVVIEILRLADTSGNTFRIPDYIRRPLCKYYTLHKAFAIEGRGQDLHASQLYLELYNIWLLKAKKLISSLYIAHNKELQPNPTQFTIPTVRLPISYGKVIE